MNTRGWLKILCASMLAVNAGDGWARDCVKETPLPKLEFADASTLGKWARYQGIWSGLLTVNSLDNTSKVDICRTLAIKSIDANGAIDAVESWGESSTGRIKPGHGPLKASINGNGFVFTSDNGAVWTYSFPEAPGPAATVALDYKRSFQGRFGMIYVEGKTDLARVSAPP